MPSYATGRKVKKPVQKKNRRQSASGQNTGLPVQLKKHPKKMRGGEKKAKGREHSITKVPGIAGPRKIPRKNEGGASKFTENKQDSVRQKGPVSKGSQEKKGTKSGSSKAKNDAEQNPTDKKKAGNGPRVN